MKDIELDVTIKIPFISWTRDDFESDEEMEEMRARIANWTPHDVADLIAGTWEKTYDLLDHQDVGLVIEWRTR
jgi:hypothetical protein